MDKQVQDYLDDAYDRAKDFEFEMQEARAIEAGTIQYEDA